MNKKILKATDNNDGNLELEAIIRDVRLEFRKLISKRKSLIQKLGNAFEKVVSNKESICEKIKNTLNEEIAEGIISARLIESYCPTQWKHKTRPKIEKKTKPENEKPSFLQTVEQTPQEQEQILVTSQGSSTVQKEPSTNMRIATKRPDRSSQEHDKPNKNAQSRASSLELSEELQNKDHYLHFEFFISCHDLRKYTISTYERGGDLIRFIGLLDKSTGKVIRCTPTTE